MYATRDLIVQHPEKPGLWKIYGRIDDQIMHSTGEKVGSINNLWDRHIYSCTTKTNPTPLGAYSSVINLYRYSIVLCLPLEAMMNHDPLVLSSVIFGRGQFNAGILIDPAPDHKFDPMDTTKLEEFRNRIWYFPSAVCHCSINA